MLTLKLTNATTTWCPHTLLSERFRQRVVGQFISVIAHFLGVSVLSDGKLRLVNRKAEDRLLLFLFEIYHISSQRSVCQLRNFCRMVE